MKTSRFKKEKKEKVEEGFFAVVISFLFEERRKGEKEKEASQRGSF